MKLNERVREANLERIRRYLEIRFGEPITRDDALNLVVESFLSRFWNDIHEVVKEGSHE